MSVYSNRDMGKKGEEQREKVIESASFCLTQFGERGLTFQAISDHCQLSQASVVKYLKTRENIFPLVLEHWISRARKITEASLLEVGSPEQKLRHYLSISIALFFEKPVTSKVYLMLHYFATFDERYRVINSQIKEVAQERIAEMIRKGIADQTFRKVDPHNTAKTIHNTLIGYLLSSVTEVSRPSDLQLAKLLEDFCLGLVLRAKPD